MKPASQSSREWREKNPERVKKYKKLWRQRKKEEIKNYMSEYRQKNKEKIKKQRKEYRQKYRKEISAEKLLIIHTNPKAKIDNGFRVAIASDIKRNGLSKNRHNWEKLVGYTKEHLMEHLEKQFKPEMNWENYGSYWHIDHIKPKSWFNYFSLEDEQFKKCWALENLQPLEATENLKKNNRYEG